MRKRKKPILLITILVCSLGAIAAMTYRPSSSQETPPPPEVGKEVATKTKEEIAEDVKKLAKDAKPTPPPKRPAGMPGEGPPMASGPIGLKPTAKPYKPVYNDSATSTQWYTSETPKDVPSKPAAPIIKKVPPPEKMERANITP